MTPLSELTTSRRLARGASAAVVLLALTVLAGCGDGEGTARDDGDALVRCADRETDRSDCEPSAPPSDRAASPSDRAVPPSGRAASPTTTQAPTETATPTPPPVELPRGGRELFPRYRLVGYSGGGSEAFGRLGVGDLDERVQEIIDVSPPLAGGREVMPVLELITVIVDPVPGEDGTFNRRVGDDEIQRYLDAARRHDAMLLLNIQPGRADFVDEVKGLEKWLVNPDVGVALDPEWAVDDGQVPGEVYGSTTGAELDGVSAWLDELVTTHDLPQKVMVFHQVAARVVSGQEQVQSRPGVVVIKSVDGIGSPEDKRETWDVLVRDLPPQIHSGIKLFYEEDARHGPLMTPEQLLTLPPQPEYVLYE